MAPIIEVSDITLETLNPEKYILRKDLENKTEKYANNSQYIYVSKQISHLGKNWFECHKELQSNGETMPTLPEFIEFLKYAQENLPEIYDYITVMSTWLDADFKVRDKKLYIHYNHVVDKNGKIVNYDSQVLDRNTLMEDAKISLEDYILKNHTSQGLPSKKVKSGGFDYSYPRDDNDSVACFYAYSGRADLDCNWNPSYRDSDRGVFSVKKD